MERLSAPVGANEKKMTTMKGCIKCHGPTDHGGHCERCDSSQLESSYPSDGTACSAVLRPFEAGIALMKATTDALPFLCRSCQWSEDEDGNWDTACNEIFTFTDGGPKENNAKFCLYCGGELVPVSYPQNAKVVARAEQPTDIESENE